MEEEGRKEGMTVMTEGRKEGTKACYAGRKGYDGRKEGRKE